MVFSTNNKRLFACIVEDPCSHRYTAVAVPSVFKRLIFTEVIAIVDKAIYRFAT
jgi:hypothetical protein